VITKDPKSLIFPAGFRAGFPNFGFGFFSRKCRTSPRQTCETTRDPTGIHKALRAMPAWYHSSTNRDISMAKLERGLRSVLDVDRQGGRLFQRDNETIVLADCSRFTSDQIECLQIVYPHIRTTVLQSDASVSVFLIIFQLASPVFKKTAALLVLHLGIFMGGLYELWLAYEKQLSP
jgi:hypothetical protein